MTHLLTGAPSLLAVGPPLLATLCEGLGYAAGALWISDSPPDAVRCAAWWHAVGLPGAVALRVASYAPGAHPLATSDLAPGRRSARADAAVRAGISHTASYVLPGSGGSPGLIELLGPSGRPDDVDDEDLMSAVVAQIAQLIDHLRLREKLRVTAGVQRAILDSASYSIVSTDKAGTIRTFNPAAERLLGYHTDDVTDRETPVLFHEAAELAARAVVLSSELGRPVHPGFDVLAARARVGTTDESEWMLVRQDGKRVPVLVSVTALHDERGDLSGFLFVGQDLARQKEVERLKDEFVSTVSHELRTPLTSIRGALGLLESGAVGSLTNQGLDLVRIARTNSDRLIRLVNDVLDLDKMAAGRLDLHLREVDPVRLVDATLGEMQGMARKAGVRLATRSSESEHVTADPDRLAQVLTNLVANAVKFAPRGGAVEVRIEPGPPGTLRFSVTDDGPGIPSDAMGKLFSKFTQLDGSDARSRGGTGLGLAISKAIIEEHGGEIGADSTVGVGSTFWFELPLSKGGDSEMVSRVILLVAGDPHWTRTTSDQLAAKGFRVVRAITVGHVERLITAELPAAVVVDLDSTGTWVESVGAARARPGEQPLVLLVVGDAGSPAIEARLPPGVEWLRKVDGNAELLRRLSRHLRSTTARVLLVDDDASARTVMAAQLAALGVTCVEAGGGTEAIQLAAASRPDLVILDVGMPAVDGYQVVEAMRHGSLRKTPLLVYSGRDLSGDERAILTLGPTRYLTKGRATIEELLATVGELVHRPHGGAG